MLRTIGLLIALGATRAAAAGSDGAAFLDIPAGARPAALAGAYSALADDAHAPVWNAAGLGVLPSPQLAAMHVDYAGAGGYEFASVVAPLGPLGGLGLSAQYFHADRSPSFDLNGAPLGSETAYFGAYTLAYGRSVTDKLSLGAAGRLIDARLGGATARTGTADAGVLYRAGDRLSLAAVAANVGGELKFLERADGLPENYRAGVHFSPLPPVSLVAEAVYDRKDDFSGRFGGEWRPVEAIAVRAGYRTETARALSALAGLTTGAGVSVGGLRFDYAWLPLGDLGQTQYFSVVFAFGKREAPLSAKSEGLLGR